MRVVQGLAVHSVLFGGEVEGVVERPRRREHVGVQKREDRVKLVQVVLHGRAREQHGVLAVQEHSSSETRSWDLVGPICESGDWLAKNRILSLAEGDLLAILSAGAYGSSLSSNYNTRNRAAEVMVRGDSFRVVRRRESLQDQLSTEIL